MIHYLISQKIRKVFAQNLSNIEAAFMYLDFRYEIMLYLLLIGIKIKQFFRKWYLVSESHRYSCFSFFTCKNAKVYSSIKVIIELLFKLAKETKKIKFTWLYWRWIFDHHVTFCAPTPWKDPYVSTLFLTAWPHMLLSV